VLALIERKAEGHDVAIQAAPEAPEEVPDLMAALEASIASAKLQGGDGKKAASKPSKRSSEETGNGSKPSASKGSGGSRSTPKKGKRATAKK
jgi:hypothetical protein